MARSVRTAIFSLSIEQKRSRTFRYTRFQAGIKCIAREQSLELWLTLEPAIVPVVVTNSLKAGNAANRFPRSCFYVIDIVVMDKSKGWLQRASR